MKKRLILLLGVFFISLLLLVNSFSAPKNFKSNTVFRVQINEPITKVAERLKGEGIIRSPKFFRMLLIFVGKDRNVLPGPYTFHTPPTIFTVVKNLSEGIYDTEFAKITIPEGATIKEINKIITAKIPLFDSKTFLEKAKNDEGYLFPDTYYFEQSVSADEVIDRLKREYSVNFKNLKDQAKTVGRTEKQIIIMASLLEKEGKEETERKIIAGILWKRYEQGMLLQVDAPFLYLLNKKSDEITLKDLKLDTPYNTYLYKGLPPTPINNPGKESVYAALQPTQTDYLFYLHDKEGNIHYAKTYKEHLLNKNNYLK